MITEANGTTHPTPSTDPEVLLTKLAGSLEFLNLYLLVLASEMQLQANGSQKNITGITGAAPLNSKGEPTSGSRDVYDFRQSNPDGKLIRVTIEAFKNESEAPSIPTLNETNSNTSFGSLAPCSERNSSV